MDKMLRGKFMVRKSKLESGETLLVLAGIFEPQNFDINSIRDNDEMWVSDIIVSGGLRFTEPLNKYGISSPEQFLEGQYQSPNDWAKKQPL